MCTAGLLRKIFINFFFKWSHLQVRLDEANGVVTLFFCFSYIHASSSSVPQGTLLSLSIGFNLITNFSGTRPLKFHWSAWFFKYQTDGIPSSSTRLMEFHRPAWFFKYHTTGIPLIWSLKFQSTLHLSTSSMNWAELHFWPLGYLSNGFQGGRNWKNNFQKIIFHHLKIDTFWRITSKQPIEVQIFRILRLPRNAFFSEFETYRKFSSRGSDIFEKSFKQFSSLIAPRFSTNFSSSENTGLLIYPPRLLVPGRRGWCLIKTESISERML